MLFADSECLDANDPNQDRLHKFWAFALLILVRYAKLNSP